MRTLIPLIAALALAACQPQAPDGSLAQPPADAPPLPAEPAPPPATPAAFQGDIDAHGTEPFWAVEIRQTQISFKTPEASIVFPAGGMAVADGAAVWESTAGDKPIKITLREQPGCSDGMSDLKYPLAAEVALGGTTYKGCAAKTSEKPREGG